MPGRRILFVVSLVFLWGTGCGIEERRTADAVFQKSSTQEGVFVSGVVDFGEERDVYRWEDLKLDFDLEGGQQVLEREYCLTNNGTPRIGNFFSYTRTRDITGLYMTAKGQLDQPVTVSHNMQGVLQSDVSFNWPARWEGFHYHALFDFKQVFTFTRVELAVISHYPNQYLPHILVRASKAESGPYTLVGEGWLPEDAREKLEQKKPYGGQYEIVANLDSTSVNARFLNIVFDKPQLGISDVLLPYVRIWGRVSALSQLVHIRVKAVSAMKAEHINGEPDEVFRGATWFEPDKPIPCPENRFIRLLVQVRPIYDPVVSIQRISGRITAFFL